MTPTSAEHRQARRDRLRGSYVERLAFALLWTGGLGLAWLVLRWVSPVLTPVLLSLLLAYFLDPLIDWFEARRVSRTVSITLVATLVLGALAVVAAVVVPTVASELARAVQVLPEWFARQVAALSAIASERFGVEIEQFGGENSVFETIAEHVQRGLTVLATAAFNSVASLLNIVIVPIFTFYFLRDFDTLKMRPLALVPPRHRAHVTETAVEMDLIVGQWARGQVQVALILSVLYAIGLGAIGVKLGVLIGIVAGLINVVPYAGAAIGIVLAAVMVLIHGSVGQLVGVGLVFFVVQMLEGYVITPRLVGERVGMSPVLVMFLILLGGSLFGFFGLLLAIPVAASSTVVIRGVLRRYRESDFFAGDAGEGSGAEATQVEPPPTAV